MNAINREPPNLRDAPCCKQCKHYVFHYRRGAYECTKYDIGVDSYTICDDYEAEVKSEDQSE